MIYSDAPIYKATQKFVDLFSAPSQTKLEVYSYHDSFEYLWSMDERLLSRIHGERPTLVIVWDSTPKDPRFDGIPIEDYLTPFDWAIAATMKSNAVVSRGVPQQTARPMEWMAFILDTSARATQPGNRLGILWSLQTGPERLFSWFAAAPSDRIAESFLSLLSGSVGTRLFGIDSIKGLWMFGLHNPGTDSIRHSIANIIAPQILLATTGAPFVSIASPIANALRVLLEASGLLPDLDQLDRGAWLKRAEWRSEGIQRFVLMDDMEDLGWADFLTGALELHEGELHSYGQNGIEAFLNETDNWEGTVLFLDLRLFARSPWSEEARFMKALANSAEKLSKSTPVGSPPCFEAHEIADVRRCAGQPYKKEDSDYHLALTFLPRIIAQLQPRLPIILFSSTGRREIVERLHAHGNIVLEFEKPRFFGDSTASIVLETQRRFVRAIRSAAKIALGRHKCSLLTQRLPAVGPSSGTPALVEIYFDESGTADDERFAVGGLAVAFQKHSDVKKLDELLISHGLIWGVALGFPPVRQDDRFPDRYFAKRMKGDRARDQYEEALNSVEKCFEEAGARVAAFCLVQDKRAFERNALSWVTNELELDNLYRVMIAEALEMVLFDFLPAFGRPEELRIDVATKEGSEEDLSKRKLLISDFGMEFSDKNKGKKYRTTRTKDIFPIVASVLSKRPIYAKNLPIRRARGITLAEFDDMSKASAAVRNPVHLRGSQLHYIADWIAHFAFRPETMPPIAKRWLEHGFIESRGFRVSHLLESRRIADSGDTVSSLVELFKTDAGDPNVSTPYVELLMPHIIDQINSLSPEEFWRLCASLP